MFVQSHIEFFSHLWTIKSVQVSCFLESLHRTKRVNVSDIMRAVWKLTHRVKTRCIFPHYLFYCSTFLFLVSLLDDQLLGVEARKWICACLVFVLNYTPRWWAPSPTWTRLHPVSSYRCAILPRGIIITIHMRWILPFIGKSFRRSPFLLVNHLPDRVLIELKVEILPQTDSFPFLYRSLHSLFLSLIDIIKRLLCLFQWALLA